MPQLPAGFTVRPVRDDADLVRHAALHREVWPRSALTDGGFRAMTGRWPYKMDFDVVVEAPDGRFVVYPRGDDEYPVPKQVYAALGFTPHARTVRYRR
jgi:hypothetical protein